MIQIQLEDGNVSVDHVISALPADGKHGILLNVMITFIHSEIFSLKKLCPRKKHKCIF